MYVRYVSFHTLNTLNVFLGRWWIQGQSGHVLRLSNHIYTVANTATFLYEATCERDKNIKKNTKYLRGNSAHDCQNAFSFRGGGGYAPDPH